METIYQCDKKDRIVFHFNKKHNEDQSIPQWIVKHQGQTYYVNHMTSDVGFHTKETPDNDHTKGALQFKGILSIVKNESGTVEAIIR